MSKITKEEALAKIEELKSEVAVKEMELKIMSNNRKNIESKVQELNSEIYNLTNQYCKDDILEEKRKQAQSTIDKIDGNFFSPSTNLVYVMNNFNVYMDKTSGIMVSHDEVYIRLDDNGNVFEISKSFCTFAFEYFIVNYNNIGQYEEMIPKETMIEKITEFTNSLTK